MSFTPSRSGGKQRADEGAARIAAWLADAAKVDGVIGVMCTTWRKNYDDLEAFAAKIKALPTPQPTD